MFTLGINAVFHDSSACILQDGKLLAAAEEERFTHIKHGKRPIPFSAYELPFHAIDYCLKIVAIMIKERLICRQSIIGNIIQCVCYS